MEVGKLNRIKAVLDETDKQGMKFPSPVNSTATQLLAQLLKSSSISAPWVNENKS